MILPQLQSRGMLEIVKNDACLFESIFNRFEKEISILQCENIAKTSE